MVNTTPPHRNDSHKRGAHRISAVLALCVAGCSIAPTNPSDASQEQGAVSRQLSFQELDIAIRIPDFEPPAALLDAHVAKPVQPPRLDLDANFPTLICGGVLHRQTMQELPDSIRLNIQSVDHYWVPLSGSVTRVLRMHFR